MAFNFPTPSTVGELFTPPGGPTYAWNGYAWVLQNALSGGVQLRVFTTNQTYTPPTGLVTAVVECVGGGGGGGGVAGAAAVFAASSGGGSGAYSRKLLTAVQIGASQAIVIGTAGNGGTAGANPGSNGGDTSFGTLCIAKGGLGGGATNGASGANAGGAGGPIAGGVGDVIAAGAPGGSGMWSNVGNTYTPSGEGGSSAFGGGAPGGTAGAAAAASAYGSGGAGAWINTASNIAGGNGSAGICIVTEYLAGSGSGGGGGGGTSVTISDTPPGSPSQGNLWWESDTGKLYISYLDPGGAPAQWVSTSGPNVVAPGSKVLIQTQTVSSAVAQVDFMTGIDSTYDEYELVWFNYKPSADSNFCLRVSTDGGATWKAGTDYTWQMNYSLATSPTTASAAGSGASGAAFVQLAVGQGASITTWGNGTVKFYKPSDSTNVKPFITDAVVQTAASGVSRSAGVGVYAATTIAFNAIRLLASTGNIASGTFNLYGIKK